MTRIIADISQFQDKLKDCLSTSYVPFQLYDDILADPKSMAVPASLHSSDYDEKMSKCKTDSNLEARDALGKLYQEAVDNLSTLKIVEYAGPKILYSTISLHGCQLRVQLYHLYLEAPSFEDETDNFPQADMKLLPHVRYEGKWDEWVGGIVGLSIEI